MCTPQGAYPASQQPERRIRPHLAEVPEDKDIFIPAHFDNSWDPEGKKERWREGVKQSYRDYHEGKIQRQQVLTNQKIMSNKNIVTPALWSHYDDQKNPQPAGDPAFYLTQNQQKIGQQKKALKIQNQAVVKTGNKKSNLSKSGGSGQLKISKTLNI